MEPTLAFPEAEKLGRGPETVAWTAAAALTVAMPQNRYLKGLLLNSQSPTATVVQFTTEWLQERKQRRKELYWQRHGGGSRSRKWKNH